MNYLRDRGSKLPLAVKIMLGNLLANCMSRPDFVAYDTHSRNNLAPWWCRKIHRAVAVDWTITDRAQMELAEKDGAAVIFEQFDPKG